MAPIPDDKSDSESESQSNLTNVVAGWIGIVILALCAIVLIITVCALLNQYV